jgi:hypothetical protein
MNKVKKNVSYIADLPELNDNDSFRRNFRPETTMISSLLEQQQQQPVIQIPLGLENEIKGGEPIIMEQHQTHPKFIRPHSGNCLDIAEHVSMCPICIRFYKHDYIYYMIVIAVLTIVCLILVHNVLSKQSN